MTETAPYVADGPSRPSPERRLGQAGSSATSAVRHGLAATIARRKKAGPPPRRYADGVLHQKARHEHIATQLLTAITDEVVPSRSSEAEFSRPVFRGISGIPHLFQHRFQLPPLQVAAADRSSGTLSKPPSMLPM